MELEINGLTKYFSRFPAVNNITFTAKSGEILGYLGPNGAGKTTTMKMLTGTLEPSSGQITYTGKSIFDRQFRREFKKNVGYVPENPHVYGHLSASEYLYMVGHLRLIEKQVLKTRIEGLLEYFGLTDHSNRLLGTYSRGMVQKVLITAALLDDPEVLVLDEALSGLDVASTLKVKDLLQVFAAEGKLIILSSHILEVIEQLCSQVIILHQGEIKLDNSFVKLKTEHKGPEPFSLEKIFREKVGMRPKESQVSILQGIFHGTAS